MNHELINKKILLTPNFWKVVYTSAKVHLKTKHLQKITFNSLIKLVST